MSSLRRNISVASDEVSALERVRHTSGYLRFVYGAYLILGILFFGIGIYTALGIVMRSLNGGAILSFETLLLFCYALLNGILGYGFIFFRRWLLVVFSSVLFLKTFRALFFSSHEAVVSWSIFIVASILFFIFLTKEYLSGRYLVLGVIISFATPLLVSFLLITLGMIN